MPNITGTVVKGPLHNALVFADYNNDGLLSAGEPSTRTAADGSFVLNSNDPSANFVSISEDYSEARNKAINHIKKLNWKNGYFRRDIGHKVIKT